MKIVREVNQKPYHHFNIIDDTGTIIATDNYLLKDIYPVISSQITNEFINDKFDENFVDTFTGEQLIVYMCIKDVDLYWTEGYLYIPISNNGYISNISNLPIFNHDGFVTTRSIDGFNFKKFI